MGADAPLAAKVVLTWLAILVAMFANGTMRVLVLQPRFGEERARQWACLTRHLLMIGVSWPALTLAFEFLYGHFGSGMTWAALLEDYNLFRGRLWVFVLLATLLSPWSWGVMRNGRRG